MPGVEFDIRRGRKLSKHVWDISETSEVELALVSGNDFVKGNEVVDAFPQAVEVMADGWCNKLLQYEKRGSFVIWGDYDYFTRGFEDEDHCTARSRYDGFLSHLANIVESRGVLVVWLRSPQLAHLPLQIDGWHLNTRHNSTEPLVRRILLTLIEDAQWCSPLRRKADPGFYSKSTSYNDRCFSPAHATSLNPMVASFATRHSELCFCICCNSWRRKSGLDAHLKNYDFCPGDVSEIKHFAALDVLVSFGMFFDEFGCMPDCAVAAVNTFEPKYEGAEYNTLGQTMSEWMDWKDAALLVMAPALRKYQ